MVVRIFEGVATSGKTTVIAALQQRLTGRKVTVLTEAETHLPIKEARKELHLQFFLDLVDRALNGDSEVVLFDRLYMTQAFRAGVGLEAYAAVEQRLAAVGSVTVLLEVAPEALAQRLQLAMEHRDPAWKSYVQGRADSVERAAELYSAQQYMLRQYSQKSLLPTQSFITTDGHYGEIAAAVYAGLPLL